MLLTKKYHLGQITEFVTYTLNSMLAILCASIFLYGCNADSIGGVDDIAKPALEDEGNVGIYLTDNDINASTITKEDNVRLSTSSAQLDRANQDRHHKTPLNLSKVLISISEIQIKPELEDWLTVSSFGSEGRVIDLLNLTNGQLDNLGVFMLEPGQYDQVRLILSGDGQVEVDNEGEKTLKPLYVPSGSQTGIKLNRPFTVDEEGVVSITINFNVLKSVHYNKGKGYMLKPTIRIAKSESIEELAQTLDYTIDNNIDIFRSLNIFVPAYTFAEDTAVGITLQSAPEDFDNPISVSKLYEFAELLTFNQPITITVHYFADEHLPVDVQLDEHSISIAYYDTLTESWISLEGTVDTENNTVTASTTTAEFTKFMAVHLLPEEDVLPEEPATSEDTVIDSPNTPEET